MITVLYSKSATLVINKTANMTVIVVFIRNAKMTGTVCMAGIIITELTNAKIVIQ